MKPKSSLSRLGWMATGAFGLAACLSPAKERAERDREVGHAVVEDIGVTVRDGLAAVRDVTPGHVRLWAGAPTFELSLSLPDGAPEEWVIEIDNAMVDAQLTLLEEPDVAPTLQATSPMTNKRWIVELEAGQDHRLRLTTPDATSSAPWRFALLSDVQEAIDDVEDIFSLLNEAQGRTKVRFLAGAGDLTERGSPAELSRFQRELSILEMPYYSTLGNHELGTSPPAWHAWFGRGSFSFVFRDVQFTYVDSGSATLDARVYGWLDDWLSEGKDRVHVFLTHIPPLDPIGIRNGGFASRSEALKLFSKLRAGNVDLTLYGHIHSHYDFENAGIQAFISGGGGAIPERFDGIGRHFMVFSVDPSSGITEARVVRVD